MFYWCINKFTGYYALTTGIDSKNIIFSVTMWSPTHYICRFGKVNLISAISGLWTIPKSPPLWLSLNLDMTVGRIGEAQLELDSHPPLFVSLKNANAKSAAKAKAPHCKSDT